MSEHTRGTQEGKFCALAPCKHHDYRAPCEADAAGWDAQAAVSRPGLGYQISKYAQRIKEGAQWRSHEAHHIACVASVVDVVLGAAAGDEAFEGAVKLTDWCINNADNMIALPLWPHTIQWYVDMFTGDLLADERDGKLVVSVGAPPFKELAQHDYDHGRYIKEVNTDLDKIADAVNKNLDVHEDPTGNLVGQLNAVIGKYKTQLKSRQTHKSWEDGMNDREGDWYKAFSMATPNNASKRAFPAGKNRMAKKIAEVMEAFLKLTTGT